jgi:hypothetical protein
MSFASENVRYEMSIVQQPGICRMAGFGPKDARPIDPVPVLELTVYKNDVLVDPNDIFDDVDVSNLVCHVTLLDEDGVGQPIVENRYRTTDKNIPPMTGQLIGTSVATPQLLQDTSGKLCWMFVFTNLSCRTSGVFKFEFSVFSLGYFIYYANLNL